MTSFKMAEELWYLECQNCGRDQMAAILQTFPNTFSLIDIVVFLFKIH